jgi:hypothetical protein
MIFGYEEPISDYARSQRAPKPVFLWGGFKDFIRSNGNYLKKEVSWFQDNFPFRGFLINFYINVKNDLLLVNPLPQTLIRGDQGWYFLGEIFSNEPGESKGLLQFTDQQLRKIKDNLMRIREISDSMNVRFYLAVAPNKSTVYGQYLPIVHSGKMTKLDQVKVLADSIGIHLVDMKEGFEAYPAGSLFYKTNSHWNAFGQFVGYQALLNHISRSGYPFLIPHQIIDYNFFVASFQETEMLRMINRQPVENGMGFRPKFTIKYNEMLATGQQPQKNKNQAPQQWILNSVHRFTSDADTLKVLFFHDSFLAEFSRFVADHFRETVFVWASFSADSLKKEKPDIMVYEIVERNLDLLEMPPK